MQYIRIQITLPEVQEVYQCVENGAVVNYKDLDGVDFIMPCPCECHVIDDNPPRPAFDIPPEPQPEPQP